MVAQIKAHRETENEFIAAKAQFIASLPKYANSKLRNMPAAQMLAEIIKLANLPDPEALFLYAPDIQRPDFQPPTLVAVTRHATDHAAEQLDVQPISLRDVHGHLPDTDDQAAWTRRLTDAINGFGQGPGKC